MSLFTSIARSVGNAFLGELKMTIIERLARVETKIENMDKKLDKLLTDTEDVS